MKKEILFTTVLLIVIISGLSFASAAKEKTTVRILDPIDVKNGAMGLVSGDHWVGEVPIIITSGGVSANTLSYCMDHNRELIIGSIYTGSICTSYRY